MRIIEAADVDLIEPFPLGELKRLVGWTHCYRTMMEVDGDPQTDEQKMLYYAEVLKTLPSWGVIDKANKLGYQHQAPLIGVIYIQPASPHNAYVHLASTRKAWGSGLMDQAGRRLIVHAFETYSQLGRLSGAILNTNKPAKAFAKRLGFVQDGLLRNFVTQNGTPRSVAHYGLLRSDQWEVNQPQLETPAAKDQQQVISAEAPLVDSAAL